MATPPPSSPTPSSSGRPATVWWAGAVASALVLAVAGYALGHSTGTSSAEDEYAKGQPKYEEIYNAGAAAGTNVGESAGEKEGEAAGRKAGREAGIARGEQVGLERGEAKGKQEGLTEGQAEGREAGATTALAFTSWNTGAPYIVRVTQGKTANVPFQVATRTQMEPGTAYELCQGSASQVCSKPVSTGSPTSGE